MTEERKTVKIGDFLTEDEIKRAIKLMGDLRRQRQTHLFATRCSVEIIKPVIARINLALGQENDPKFLAYAVEFALTTSGIDYDDKGKVRW